MKVNLTTGCGYAKWGDGSFAYKFVFSPGEHEFPDGLTIVEVADEATLHSLPEANPGPSNAEKWRAIREQRDDLLKQVKVMGELVLFLAESEAIKAGRITTAERTITPARAIDVALYMRNLYRVMSQANPDNIDWPVEP